MNSYTLISAATFSPQSLEKPYAWIGHLPFASWVIQQISPKVFVELGTHSGNSYFSFCQSVSSSKLLTKCYAVDTWEGDQHAGNYEQQVFEKVHQHNQLHYAHFSTLMRMTFDEALREFADASVDLLHIDGLHTYEAVKHDFETWLPKLKPGAIVLFHDTNVYQQDFGVWKFWKELQTQYPNNLEFFHSHGLGVLQINPLTSAQTFDWLQVEVTDKKKFVEYFEVLGNRLQEEQQLVENKSRISALEAKVNELGAHAHHLHLLSEERNTKNNLLQTAVEQLNLQKKSYGAELNALHASFSWRLTKPVRFVSRQIKRILKV